MTTEHINIKPKAARSQRRSDPHEAVIFKGALTGSEAGAMETISREVGVLSSHVEKAEIASSQTETTNQNGMGESALITPLYNFEILTSAIEGSSNLRPIVSSMIANTTGYGYRLVKRDKDPIKTDDPVFLGEQIDFENFAEYCGRDSDLLRVLEELAWDFYLTGNAFCEVVRRPPIRSKIDNRVVYKPGRIVGVYRAQAYKMKMTAMEDTPHTLQVKQARRTSEGYTIRDGWDQKRFRRYAQRSLNDRGHILSGSGNFVWFSEFQESRFYRRDTGEVIKGNRDIAKQIKAGNIANEMIHFSSPITRGSYGFPYYIGNLSAIAADVATDNINLATVNQNMIPSMVVMVSGNGALTTGSWDRMTDFTKSKFAGKDNRSRFLVLEAEPIGEYDEDNGNLRIDIKSLHETQKDDQMFQGYRENALGLVRESFRLPEILVGRGEAASGVVVAASMKLADEQVFTQDRNLFVDWINRRLMPEMGWAHITIELNSPNATDTATLATLIGAMEKAGAMTPEIARWILERILGTDLPAFITSDELAALAVDGQAPIMFDPKIPMTLTTAMNQKRQNENGENNPTGSNDPDRDSTGGDPAELGQTIMAAPAAADDG